jgi:hypothetical protein
MRASDDNRTLYWIIGGVLVVLCVIGLITFSGERETQQARDKAQELSQKLEQAGLGVPDEDILVRTLGTDGGTVCDNPATALGRATAFAEITNGASFVGRRPVIIDEDVLEAEKLILATYCPDELDEYRDKFDDLKTDDTIKD